MKITAEPRSDQWNADDFIGGPRTFTIAGVKVGAAEQKYDIDLVEGDGRVWRPPLTMLRMLITAWGDDATVWTGRRVTLYRDASIRFGSDAVGGIRISHLSHINKTLTVSLTESRGKRKPHRVEPLPDGPAPTTPKQVAEFEHRIADATDEPELIRPAQLKKLVGLLREQGFGDDDRQARLDYCAAVIGRAITSSKELTVAEGTRVIDTLEAGELPHGDERS